VTLTDHPVIASMRDERDVEQPTVEIPELGTFVVTDGDYWDAERLPDLHQVCYCDDGKHHRRDRDDMGRSWPTEFIREAEGYAEYHGGHVVTLRPIAYVTENDPHMSRDGNRDLRGDEINRIRQDLDKRPPADVKKAERQAKNAAAKDSAIRSGGDEKDRKSIFGTIFGGSK